ncbi:hypothetical protein DMA15_02790 [Streptomyces sp. WAC 01529]|nr:hypothetical protein DMA15_02790 [Streptomyces sp. WAC 01529]
MNEDRTPSACGRPGPGDQPTVADRAWLAIACRLATHCPPSDSAFSVGAVIVADDGTELARAHSREKDTDTHAEESVLAKVDAGDPRLPDATLYSSLEPFAEPASRPRPRTRARLVGESGVRRVVTACREPGTQSTESLEAAGVTVLELPEYADAAKSPNAHLL